MDTKVIGRGANLPANEKSDIRLVYVCDLTAETAGNALGVGLADVIHKRLFRKIDIQKTPIYVRTSLNPPIGWLPIYLPTDRWRSISRSAVQERVNSASFGFTTHSTYTWSFPNV